MHVDHIPLRRGIRHFLSPLGGVFALLLALMLPLQALAQCVNENIALRGLASATSTLPGYSAARINDGNLSTALGGAYSWSNAPATAVTPAVPVYLKVQLPAEKVVNTVYVYSTLGREIRDYDLQFDNGTSWNTIEQVRDNTNTVRLNRFAPVNPYEVRIIGLQGPSMEPKQVRINEIVICVAEPNPTTTVSGIVRQYGTNGSLQNVRVDLGGNLSGFTDANGYYRIDNVPTGTYTVRATRAGWTFGSAQYQNSQYAIQVAGAPVSRDLTGYDRNPIVYATGWTDNYARFNPVRGTLSNAGYFPVEAMIQTSFGYTPTLQTNALKVRAGIDTALYTTGQPRAILFGHSMGGLVLRSALHQGALAGQAWPERVSEFVCLGTPHHGAPLERAGHGVDILLSAAPYAAPLARLARVRSAGIMDLRHGNLMPARHGANGRALLPASVQLPAHIKSYAVAAQVGDAAGGLKGRVLGDGLVPVASALGRHTRPARTLAFAPEHQAVLQGMHHLELLNRKEAAEQLLIWLR